MNGQSIKRVDNINVLKHKCSDLVIARENSNGKVLTEKKIKKLINQIESKEIRKVSII